MYELRENYHNSEKTLFASVFKRNDLLKNCSNSFETQKKQRSSSFSKNKIQNEEKFSKNSEKIQKEQNFRSQSVQSIHNQLEINDNRDLDISHNNEKFEKLLRKYDRMEEFYKTQIQRLIEEANHYKILYRKTLMLKSSDKA